MDQEVKNIPQGTRNATKHMVELLLNKIRPEILQIRNKLESHGCEERKIEKVREVFTLCCNQITKCFINLLDIFRLEYKQHLCLQESRQCNIERLQWCINRLTLVGNYLKSNDMPSDQDDSFYDSINVTVMYFVNWIDHTFEVLAKLTNAALRTDYKETNTLYDAWKNDILECVTELHVSIDELLLSAMTLCKYCLPSDQHIVKARCQVVLRETKSLLGELVEGDVSSTIKATLETLKLPIMPSNIIVLIDVLKDVLYVLETNTNTALLAVLIHCFSNSMPPVDVLRNHFSKNTKGTCKCVESGSGVAEDCAFVKDFDLYNERLLQIGSFAVSCSSDQNRILTLKSGLASLEVLDPHLVPALMISPDSYHSILLMDSWRQEVREIRDSVFLIVDPAAFAEKSKHMMHTILLGLLNECSYKNSEVCAVINIGCVVYDFFSVYNKYEPDALTQHEKLAPLLLDLKKVQTECKIVSNLLSTDSDFLYEVKTPQNKEVSNDQLLKRLKLLYTIISRINDLLHPKDNDDNLLDGDEEPALVRNATHTLKNNFNTFISSPKNDDNISRSMLVRTCNGRSSTRNFPLTKLTKYLPVNNELSFSVQLDNLLNESKGNMINNGTFFVNKHLDHAREHSILYKFSPIKNRASLRKAVLSRHKKLNGQIWFEDDAVENTAVSERESLLDDATSLQITDVLNEMNDITDVFSNTKPGHKSFSRPINRVCIDSKLPQDKVKKNALTLNINNPNVTITKHIWKIPVNSSTVEMPMDETIDDSNVSNLTQPSNVTTLERVSDLDYVESKLNSLKSQLETTL